MPRPNETYLGDGLYASFDGYQVWLRAPREHDDHEIALEPSVLDAFDKYIRELKYNLLHPKG
jgi:hypothetical protein